MPRVGFEPTAYRLRSGCSTAELSGRYRLPARGRLIIPLRRRRQAARQGRRRGGRRRPPAAAATRRLTSPRGALAGVSLRRAAPSQRVETAAVGAQRLPSGAVAAALAAHIAGVGRRRRRPGRARPGAAAALPSSLSSSRAISRHSRRDGPAGGAAASARVRWRRASPHSCAASAASAIARWLSAASGLRAARRCNAAARPSGPASPAWSR